MNPLHPHDLMIIENLGSEFCSLLQSTLPKGLNLDNFEPKVVLVPPYMDISRMLISLARENNGEIYVLLGIGVVWLAQIRQGDRSATLRGTYGMRSLRGKCVVPENGAGAAALSGLEELDISLITRNSLTINASVNGHLVSATPCHLWVATKTNPPQRAAAPPNGSGSRKRGREEAV